MTLFELVGKIVIKNQDANDKLEETTSKASGSSSKIVSAFKTIGTAVATYFAVDKIAEFGLACIEAASDAAAASSQFTQVFGDLEGQASESLSSIADTAGVSENRLKSSFTSIAAFAKTTGMDTESSLELSERAMVAVADSAAFYDRTLEETTESLQSFLKGNYENDAALGLSCTETTRNAAANELYGTSFDKLSESQKQLTLLQMVEDANEASGALGQAARESETWTNQTGNLKQAWTDFKAALGENVLDSAVSVVKKMVGALESCTEKIPAVVEWFGELKTKAEELGVFSWLSDKVEAARSGFEKVADFAQRLWNNLEPLVSLIRDNLVSAFQGLSEPVAKIKDVFQQLEPIFSAVASILGGALAASVAYIIGRFNGLVSAISGIATVVSGVVEIVAGCIQAIVGVFTGDGEMIQQAADNIGQGIIDVFGGLWDAVSGYVSGFVESVISFFTGLWDTLVGHSIVPDTIDGIVDCFAGLWDKVSGFVSGFVDSVTGFFTDLKDKGVEKFNELKDKATTAASNLKDKASSAWNTLKDKTSSAFSTAKDKAVSAWNTLKDKVSSTATSAKDSVSTAWSNLKEKTSSQFNEAKDNAATAFSSMKSNVVDLASSAGTQVGNKFNSMKSTISLVVSNAKSLAVSAFSSMKSSISTAVSGAYSVVAEKFDSIKSKISSVMDSAKSLVSTAIDKIKSAFDIDLKLNIKLPHITVSGGEAPYGIGGEGSLPSFSVEWYKKAYDKAMILSDPTIFGYSAASGKMLAGGEGNGNEVVAGESHLMNLIGQVVENKTAGQNNSIIEILIAILNAITGGNEEMIAALMSDRTFSVGEREFGRLVKTYAR